MTFDILDPHQNIFQNTFLQASAGTGKTFAIQHLISRFVLEGDQPLKIDQILAITFTREAAKEMRERVEENLAALRIMVMNGQVEGYLGLVPPEEALRRIEEAELSFDSAPIYTIHGFCKKMLVENALYASFPLRSDGDFDHRVLMRRSIKDTLSDPAIPKWELMRLLGRSRMDFDRLVGQLIAAMEMGEKPEDSVAEFKEALLSFHERGIRASALASDLDLLIPHHKRMTNPAFPEQAQLLAQWIAGVEPTQSHWDGLLVDSEWFLERLEKDNVKLRAPDLTTLPLNYPRLSDELHEQLVPLWEKARDRSFLLKRMAQRCMSRFEELKRAHEVYSPDEILEAMEVASKNSTFQRLVAGKFRAVIIDEFQDTDPLQWKIVRSLFLEGEIKPTLFLVGDPKQSIYGFRKADVYAYMEAYKVLGEKSCAHLTTNYRSRAKLIDALNALFAKDKEWLDLPSLKGALNYQPVVAGRGEGREELGAPIEFCLGSGSIGRGKSFPTKALEQEVLFPFIAAKALEHRKTHGLAWKEIAVLVKDRFQAQRLHRFLSERAIPCTIKRSMSLTQTPGFAAMQELLLSATRPRDRAAFLKVVLGPLVCGRAELVDGSVKQQWLALCQKLKEEGFSSFYEAFLHLSLGDRTVYETLARSAPLFNQVRQIASLLMEVHFHRYSEILPYLQSLCELTPEEDERLALQEEAGEEALAIMTLFASKGLEFDVVFAPGLTMRGPAQGEEDPEKEAEKMRGLYVALTRAKEKLYLPLFFEEDQKPLFAGVAAPMERFLAHLTKSSLPLEKEPVTNLLQELEPFGITTRWLEGKEENLHPEEKKAEILTPPLLLKLYIPPSEVHSFTSLSQKSHQPSFELQDTKGVMPLGAQTGVIIHSLFERLFQNGGYKEPSLLEQTVRATLLHTHLEDWEEQVRMMATKALIKPLVGGACLADLKPGAFMQEMEFLFAEEGKLIKGFADLVFQLDGKFYLLDWKTNWLGPDESDYSEEKLQEAMVAHDYFLQAKIYTEALGRYVKQFYMEPFESLFGGAIYYFLRGDAPYCITSASSADRAVTLS